MILTILLFIVLMLPVSSYADPPIYSWLAGWDSTQTIAARIPTPQGYGRIEVERGSFGEWLRYLPLKPPGSKVHLHNGGLKADQSVHVAVIDIDVGRRNLQQCADAVMRLRAEYFFSIGRYDVIRFNFTSGDPCPYVWWRGGKRPVVEGNNITWKQTEPTDTTYIEFRRYLDKVFMYAGTASLSREMLSVQENDSLQIGDVFIKGGAPGHAVIVVDLAHNPDTGHKLFLLAQSYMPAQEMHILKDPRAPDGNPWYFANLIDTLYTPEWIFERKHLKRSK